MVFNLRRRLSVGRSAAALTTLAVTAALFPVLATPAGATTPTHVQSRLEGCRASTTAYIPGTFVCSDGNYTTGNLGPGWNELDLVPHRLTTELGNQGDASTDYSVALVADNLKTLGGAKGYDKLSVPATNAVSDASCSISSTGQQSASPGVGGVYNSIYQVVTIHQNRGTTCVFDWVQRLALGSHLYSGSSLHSNATLEDLSTAGIGARDVSIPVNEIAPQQLSKSESSSQGSAVDWSVTKTVDNSALTFNDTCGVDKNGTLPLKITISWTKVAKNAGDISVLATITLVNPSHRDIKATVSDQLYLGADQSTPSGSPDLQDKTVLAGQTLSYAITRTVASGTASSFNDIATATYKDPVFNDEVIGTLIAKASSNLVQLPANSGATATLQDVEALTGSSDFEFRVDSVTPSGLGSFSGYTLGTYTAGPVTWNSTNPLSTSGSVAYDKTVRVKQATAGTATLGDTATLSPAGQVSTAGTASSTITGGAKVSLVVSKTQTLKLATAKTFNFTVTKVGEAETSGSTSITLPAGSTGPVTGTISALDPATAYTLDEAATSPYASQQIPVTTASLPTCSSSQDIVNSATPANARVLKTTAPTGSTSWDFTLTGTKNGSPLTVLNPDNTTSALSETVTATANAGYVDFSTTLEVDGATYVITETAQTGWDLTSISGDMGSDASRATTDKTARTCSVTLDLTKDSGTTFECSYANTQQGTIIVKKVTDPVGAPGSFSFSGNAAGSISGGGTITVSNLAPGTYTSTEADPTPGFDLTKIDCDDAASGTASSGATSTRTATFKLDAGETVTCTFTNTQRGTAKVVKTVAGAIPSGTDAFVFQLRSGSSVTLAGATVESSTANAGNAGVINFSTKLTPGTTYQLCEVVMPGWMTSLGPPLWVVYNPSGDNSTVCVDFSVTAGGTKTFFINNTRPPGGMTRTIGFWKNWSSCSGGKQRPVLDQTLAKADPAGTAVGDLTLHGTDCSKAVNILNKTTIDGKKMASDPAFNMAAQLLAAKLNVGAGAGQCQASINAISQGQALLDTIDFNGLTHKKMTAAQISQANTLAGLLDKYNQDNTALCI